MVLVQHFESISEVRTHHCAAGLDTCFNPQLIGSSYKLLTSLSFDLTYKYSELRSLPLNCDLCQYTLYICYNVTIEMNHTVYALLYQALANCPVLSVHPLAIFHCRILSVKSLSQSRTNNRATIIRETNREKNRSQSSTF